MLARVSDHASKYFGVSANAFTYLTEIHRAALPEPGMVCRQAEGSDILLTYWRLYEGPYCQDGVVQVVLQE